MNKKFLLDEYVVLVYKAYDEYLYNVYTYDGHLVMQTFKSGMIRNNGNQLLDDTIVGTGCMVELCKEGQVADTATVAVKGDTDGTGTIDVLDMEVIQKSILGIEKKLNGAYREAASLTENTDEITVLDMEAIQKDILGIQKIN